MSFYIHTEADLDTALNRLVAADPRFGQALAVAGKPPLRRRPDGFAGLVRSWCRSSFRPRARAPSGNGSTVALDPLDHAAVLRARTAKLARAGLSAPKIRTLKAVAKAIDRGEIDLATLADRPADEAHAALTALHGIGPWTADIYLLFCLGHADAWPAGDLALQEAARLLLALPKRPTTRDMAPLAEPWRPWRGAAACMLWTYYRAAKQRDGAPVAASPSVRSS